MAHARATALSFTTVLATIAGGLVGVLAPTGGSARASQPGEERTTPPSDIQLFGLRGSRRTGVRTGVCDRRDRRRRNTSHWRVRERYGHQRSPQVPRRRRSPFRPGHERTTPREAARVGVFPPRLPRALRALFHEAAGRGGRASSFRRAGAIATRFEHRRSHRPCHPRATSSGHGRYPADNHGHFAKAGGLGAHP